MSRFAKKQERFSTILYRNIAHLLNRSIFRGANTKQNYSMKMNDDECTEDHQSSSVDITDMLKQKNE
jgi:hypothetical protein